MNQARSSRARQRVVAALRQPMALAFVGAGLVSAILALAVFAAWSATPSEGERAASIAIDGSPAGGGEAAPPTPTPRVIAPRTTAPPTPAGSGPAAPPEVAAVPQPTARPPVQIIGAVPTVTPRATAPTITPRATTAASAPTARPRPSATASPEALFAAEGAAELGQLATGSWAIGEEQLVNDAAPIVAEPWLRLPYQPRGDDYAVEVEIRVKDLAQGYSCQSVGMVAGAGSGAPVWGAGLVFPCANAPTRARITDLSNVGESYHDDPELAAEPFEPEPGWHTYRLEVSGNRLRFLIDGEEIVSATATEAAPNRGRDQIGLWTQGVRFGVRRITVLPV